MRLFLSSASLVMLFALSASANGVVWDKEISVRTYEVDVPVSEDNLHCQFRDDFGVVKSYGRLLWNSLGDFTQLEHNRGLYSSSCVGIKDATEHASKKNGMLHAAVTVRLQEELVSYPNACYRQLHETVSMEMDGIKLSHQAFVVLENKPMDKCHSDA